MKIFQLLSLFFLLSFQAIAQDPAYFIIGEDELANQDIYSIVQTPQGDLYITTNQGAFVYRHGKFSNIPGPAEQIGTDLFSIVVNRDGVLFCGNLNGQVFRIQEGQMELFFQIPDTCLGKVLRLGIDPQDRLWVISAKTLRIDNPGAADVFSDEFTVFPPGHLMPNGDFLFIDAEKEVIQVVSSRGDSLIHAWTKGEEFSFLRGLSLDGNGLLMVVENLRWINAGGEIQEIPIHIDEKIFSPWENSYWLMNPLKGIRNVTVRNGNLQAGSVLFADRFISTVQKGNSETVFFGTFGEGLLVVPNPAMRVLSADSGQEHWVSICEDGGAGLFASTQNGNVFHLNEKNKKLIHRNGKRVSRMFWVPGFDFEILPEAPGLLFDYVSPDFKHYPFKPVKDFARVNPEIVLLASSQGIVVNQQNWRNLPGKELFHLGFYRLKNPEGRCNAIEFSSETGEVFFASQRGTGKINLSGEVEEVLFEEAPLFVNDIQEYEGKLWFGTDKNGVLVWRNGSWIDKIDLEEGLLSATVEKIRVYNGRLYVMHSSGIQILDLETKTWTALGSAEGVSKGSVKDFAIAGGRLWFLSGKDIKYIALEDIAEIPPGIQLTLDSVRVNGKQVEPHPDARYHYLENRHSFYFHLSALEHYDEAFLEYRIQANDSGWTTGAPHTSEVEYPSLSPGKYVFEARAAYRDYRGPSVKIPFTILRPFWQSGWFLLLLLLAVGIIILTIVYLYSRAQIRRQKQQTELNASKLTAIQSQMNPHFIFNSLNSIQELVLDGDVDKAYAYISKFSNLVRNTLTFSEQEFISFEEEIRLIELYLTLEKLRFREKFDYEIIYDTSWSFKLPPMLIQPFIENSLHHGLLHKGRGGQLKIQFEWKENILVCIVEDNGIGRKAAGEIQRRQGNPHTSFSGDAIRRRFRILRQKYSENVGYEYEDLEANGKGIGTRVKLRIPIKRLD